MAIHSSPGRTPHWRSSRDGATQVPPEVARPTGTTWAALEADGIRWEGQVLVVGGGADLAARLILTTSRFVLVSDGKIALEVPRSWLRPGFQLLVGNGVRVSMTPEGSKAGSDETDRLLLRVRAGRGAAAQLVGAMTGRIISPRADDMRGSSTLPSGDIPAWGDRVGAALPMALPSLPDFDDEPDTRQPWPPIEHQAVPARNATSSPPRVVTPVPRPAATPSSTTGNKSAPRDVAFRESAAAPIPAWSSEPAADIPAAVPAAVSRAARRNATLPDGKTVSDKDAQPYVAVEHHEFNRGLVWGLRLIILLLLLGTGLYFGRDRISSRFDLSLPASVEQQLGLNRNKEEISQIPAANDQAGSANGAGTGDVASNVPSDGTNGAPNGGAIQSDPTHEATDTSTSLDPALNESPTKTPAPAESDGADSVRSEPTAVSERNVAVDPTQEFDVEQTAEPTQTPTAVPTDEPTQTPTAVPTDEPTQTPTAVPTDEPTAVPTDEPTQAPTATATTEATQEVTEELIAAATLESQPASFAPNTAPAQSVADGTFRYSIEGAAIGDTIPELPQVNDVGSYGQWLVLSLYGENRSDTEQVFDMSQFKLYADGEEILLDVGNSWVSSLLGYKPAYGNTDAILWAPDEGHYFALTFLAPPDAKTLVLKAGDQTIDLSGALEESAPLAGPQDPPPSPPEYIEATVVDVLDGETIVIEQDGIQQTVRYLGIDAPTRDDCFAADATAANAKLVDGKKVRIERQATDVDARGNWVRDVWVEGVDGQFILVAESLVAEGAVKAGISEPNTRFAGWLTGTQTAAEAQGEGVWGSCESPASTTTEPSRAVIDPRGQVSAWRKTRS